MNIREVISMLPGIQVNIPASISATDNHIIYSSSNSLFIYQRRPYMQFYKAIQVNNVLISALDANDKYIAAACSDMKVRFYDLHGFEASREVLLARDEAPVSVRFHPRLPDTILILYDGDDRGEVMGELKAINYQNGRSTTLVTNLAFSKNLIVSPHSQEIAVSARDGMVRLYGIGDQGQVTYQRFLLASGAQSLTVYDKNGAEGTNSGSQYSFSNNRINLILKCLKLAQKRSNKIPEVVDVSYDPFDSDAMLVGWSNGIIGLFSTRSGQCLRFFMPRKSLKCLTFSKNKPGIFWTGENSGVICKWSIGESECLTECKLVQDNIERIYGVGVEMIVGVGNGEMLLLNEDGKIILKIKDKHNQAVLDIALVQHDKQLNDKTIINTANQNKEGQNSDSKQAIQAMEKNTNEVSNGQNEEEDQHQDFPNDVTQQQDKNSVKQESFQARQRSVNYDDQLFVTASASGSSYFCGIDSASIQIDGVLQKSAASIEEGRMTRLETLQGQSAVCVQNYKNLILVGYGNGNIIAFMQKSAMAVSHVVNPKKLEVTYDEVVIKWLNSNELRYNITHVQRPVYSVTDLKCMKLYNDFLFTGWLSGTVRVFRLNYQKAPETALPTVESTHVFHFNVSDHTGVASTQDTQFVQVNAIDIKDNVLYVACSQGLFVAFDVTQMLQDAKNLPKDVKANKLKMQMYKNSTFFCNFPLKTKEGDTIANKQIDTSLYTFSARILTGICVYTPSDVEKTFIKQSGFESVEKVIYLVDNKGYILIIGQTSGPIHNSKLIILNRFYHEFNSYIIELKKLSLGFSSVQKLDENFSVLLAGAEGHMAAMYWHTGEAKILDSSKSDFTKVLVTKDFLVAGCIDGSVKIIQYKYGNSFYCSELIKNIHNSYLKNEVMKQSLLENVFNDKIYQIDNLKSSITQQYDLWQVCPMPNYILLDKIKVLLFMMVYKISQAIGISLKAIYDFDQLIQDVCNILCKYSVEINQNSEVIQNKYPDQLFSLCQKVISSKVTIYNISIDLRAQPSKIYLQELFNRIIEIGIAINKIELLSSFLLQIGLVDQSAKLSFYCNDSHYKAKLLRDVYAEKYKKSPEPTPGDRWNLQDYFPIDDLQFDYLRRIKALKCRKVITTSGVMEIVKMLISDYKFLTARLLLQHFNDVKVDEQMKWRISNLNVNVNQSVNLTVNQLKNQNAIQLQNQTNIQNKVEVNENLELQTPGENQTENSENAILIIEQLIALELAQFYCNILEPAAASMELFVVGLIDQALQLLLFSGDAPIIIFICQLLKEAKQETNFSQILLHIAAFEVICKNAQNEEIQSLLHFIESNQDIQELQDSQGIILPKGLALKEYYRIHTLQYDNDIANQCYEKIINKTFDIQIDFIHAIHLFAKIVANELYGSEKQRISEFIAGNKSESDENTNATFASFNHILNTTELITHLRKISQKRSKTITEFICNILSKININDEQLGSTSHQILHLSRFLVYVSPDSPSKTSEIHLLLFCGACRAAQLGHSRATRAMLSGAFRAAKKGSLRFISDLQKAQSMGSVAWYEKHTNGTFCLQHNGRSAFTPPDLHVFPLVLPVARNMEWYRWFFI